MLMVRIDRLFQNQKQGANSQSILFENKGPAAKPKEQRITCKKGVYLKGEASDSWLIVLAAGAGLSLMFMPDILRLEASALDLSDSLTDGFRSILTASEALIGQMQVFATTTTAFATPILINGVILILQIILALAVLGIGIFLSVRIWDRIIQKKEAKERKMRPNGKPKELTPEEQYNREWEDRERARWIKRHKRFIEAYPALRTKWAQEDKEKEDAQRKEKEEADKMKRREDSRVEREKSRGERLRHEYHRDSDLDCVEREQLFAKGYQKLKTSPFGNAGSRWYWVKPRGNERKDHAFFCYFIRDMIEDIEGIEVGLNELRGADVVFGWKGKTYAIDVETGTNMEKHKSYLVERYSEGSSYMGPYDVMFIFVTSKMLKRKYARFGNVITRGTFRKVMGEVFRK